MMRPLSKKTELFIFLGIVVFLCPSFVFAKENSRQAFFWNKGNSGFCGQIDLVSTRIIQDISSREEKYENNEEQKQISIDELYARNTGEKDQSRMSWDTSRGPVFDNLNAKAKTRSQKLAVQQFQATLDEAIMLRRAEIDEAREHFYEGIRVIKLRRDGIVASSTLFLKQEEENALLVAKTDCKKGIDPKKVREQYIDRLKIAKKHFQERVDVINETDREVRVLIEERKETVEKATNGYKNSIELAEKMLRKSLSGIQ